MYRVFQGIKTCARRWTPSYWMFFIMTGFTWGVTTSWLGVGWQDVDPIKALVANLLPALYMIISYDWGRIDR